MDADVDGQLVLSGGFEEALDEFGVVDGFAEFQGWIRADVVCGFGQEESCCAGF